MKPALGCREHFTLLTCKTEIKAEKMRMWLTMWDTGKDTFFNKEELDSLIGDL